VAKSKTIENTGEEVDEEAVVEGVICWVVALASFIIFFKKVI